MIAILFSMGASCGDQVINPAPDTGTDYYPLEIGKFLEYQLDSVIFDDAGGGNRTDTLRSVVRETISAIDTDALGDTVYLIERRWKRNQEDPWKLADLWSASKNQFDAIRKEGNLPFQVLKFPLSETQTWKYTSFIDQEVEVPVGSEVLEVYNFWSSEVLSYDQSEMIGEFDFTDRVMTVSHASEVDDLLHFRDVKEKYVRGIGLVHREMSILDSRCVRLGDPNLCLGEEWDEKAEKGFRLTQTLIAHN